jgi:hypothetical protein
MKLIFTFITLICCSVFSEVTHSGLTGTNIHTSYRWLFADSTARANQTVVASDTMKFAYQRSDSSTWILVAATGTKWRRVSISQDLGTTASPIFNKVTTTRDSTSDLIASDTVKGAAIVGGTVSGTKGVFSDTLKGTVLRLAGNIFGRYSVLDSISTGNIRGNGTVSATDTLRSDGVVIASKLTTNGTNFFTYIEGTMACTLKTSDVTVQQVGAAYWTKIGNVFTVSIPKLRGTSNSTLLRIYCRFPYKPKLTDGTYNDDTRSVVVFNNGTMALGVIEVPEYFGFITLYIGVNSSGFTNSGEKGIYAPFTITYITE